MDLESNPWTTLSTREVYSNKWMTLSEHQVIRPDGAPGLYSVIDTRIATGVVALTGDQQIYLVGQYRYPTKMYSWEIPEGGADPGEAPLDAIKRELREEAGVIAQQWRQLGGEIHLSNCFTSEHAHVYLATELTEVEPDPDDDEVLQVKKVSFSEALDLIDTGVIVDAISIIAILRAERLLRLIR